MTRSLLVFLLVFCSACAALANEKVLIVSGAEGTPEYGGQFAEWIRDWQAAAKSAGAQTETIGGSANDREALQHWLAGEKPGGDDPLWLVLIGHGTFDGEQAKFNLRGADVSARELKTWLAPFTRPLVVVDLSAASAPFLPELRGPGRAIVTATRSGSERNFAHFGGFFSKAIASTDADLDKDGETSLLEAFVFAAHATAAFYETSQRIATEHALLEDNGDGRGTPAEAFHRLETVRLAKNSAQPDGDFARELTLLKHREKLAPELESKRRQIEAGVALLRKSKADLPEADYYRRLEILLLDLARLDQRKGANSTRR